MVHNLTRDAMATRRDKLQVWYCVKFDEIHLIKRFSWNKWMCATFVDATATFPYEWVVLTWPRPEPSKWVYLGGYE